LGSVVDEKLLHPGCLSSAKEIHNTAVIAEELKETYPHITIALDYAAFAPDAGKDYRWGAFEEEEAQAGRMGGFVKAISAKQTEGETVLCVSHGGPCNGLYRHMMQCGKDDKVPSCGFTGLYLYKPREGVATSFLCKKSL
jgi:broad specificity phosphatase PhoE